MIINSHVYLKSDAFIKDEDEEEVDTKKDHISSCNSSDSFHAFTYTKCGTAHATYDDHRGGTEKKII